ncbi:Thioredoxin domain-containing protein 17 [Anthophora quadrimaculata]
MITRHYVQGYESFFELMKNFKSNESVYVLYTGTKLQNGNSWCPDCVKAEPTIEEGFKTAPEGTHFVEVQVGDRPFWKDSNCPFRTNSITKLKVLPTLAKWDTQKRLEGSQCSQLDLIEMLLTDED